MAKNEKLWRCPECGDINPFGCVKCHCGMKECDALVVLGISNNQTNQRKKAKNTSESHLTHNSTLAKTLYIVIPIIISIISITICAKPVRELIMKNRCGYTTFDAWNRYSFKVGEDNYFYFSEIGCNIIMYAVIPIVTAFWSYFAYENKLSEGIIGYVITIIIILLLNWFLCHVVGIIFGLAIVVFLGYVLFSIVGSHETKHVSSS